MSDVEHISTIIERHIDVLKERVKANQRTPMSKTDIRTIRSHMKILAEREDHLHREMKFPGQEDFHYMEREANALAWALSVLIPLVKLKEAKIERERMGVDQSSKGNIEELK